MSTEIEICNKLISYIPAGILGVLWVIEQILPSIETINGDSLFNIIYLYITNKKVEKKIRYKSVFEETDESDHNSV